MTNYDPNTIAISADDHKLAALFFDMLYPMHSLSSVPKNIVVDIPLDYPVPTMIPDKSWHELAPGEIINFVEGPEKQFCAADTLRNSGLGEAISESETPPPSVFKMLPPLLAKSLQEKENKKQQDAVKLTERIRFVGAKVHAPAMFRRMGLPAVPIVPPGSFNEYAQVLDHNASLTSNLDVLLVTLGNLRMIDTKTATWEQVLQFRNDKDAISMLRQLRLWYHKECANMDAKWIQDHISDLIEKHERACRKHGFDLNLGAVSAVINSKILRILGGATVAAYVTGNSSLGALAGAATLADATLEIGNAVITRVQKSGEYLANTRDIELAYLFHLKSKFD